MDELCTTSIVDYRYVSNPLAPNERHHTMDNYPTNEVPVPSGDTDTPPPPAMRDGWHPSADNLSVTLYKDNEPIILAQDMPSVAYRLDVMGRQIDSLNETVSRLSNEQIMGDDHRLTTFWEKAQELADNAGHCSVYDEIAEALGGPAREREFEIEFTFTYSVTVTARDDEGAVDLARELVEDTSAGDMYEYDYSVN
jgi:hypothetical protein